MNKGFIAAAAGILLMSVGWAAVRWTAPETATAPPPSASSAPAQPASVAPPPPVVDEPVPVADLAVQSEQLQAYTEASGPAGEVHRQVASQADEAGLLMRDRLWVHGKVDRWLTTVREYQEQVAQGEMSAGDAATNADEDLESLAMRLEGRTPEVRDAVISALRQMNN